MIPKYWEEVIVDYKTFVGFKKGLERKRVISYQFKYKIDLTYFNIRYPNLEFKDPLTSYLKDH